MSTHQAVQNETCKDIQLNGFAKLSTNKLAGLIGINPASFIDKWKKLHTSWNNLCKDNHLKDGGMYRLRRHSCFIQNLNESALTLTAHRAHWQPTEFNALHGGYDRMFEPIEQDITHDQSFLDLITELGKCFATIHPTEKWFIEAHQFRINTNGGIGRPTPEGAHRDGVDYVVVMMLGRNHVKGGETRVFRADGPTGVRFVMDEPFSAILLDDEKVIHETTPIQPESEHFTDCYRDTLVLTFRAGGFQSPQNNM